jgi:hypothetical protein
MQLVVLTVSLVRQEVTVKVDNRLSVVSVPLVSYVSQVLLLLDLVRTQLPFRARRKLLRLQAVLAHQDIAAQPAPRIHCHVLLALISLLLARLLVKHVLLLTIALRLE